MGVKTSDSCIRIKPLTLSAFICRAPVRSLTSPVLTLRWGLFLTLSLSLVACVPLFQIDSLLFVDAIRAPSLVATGRSRNILYVYPFRNAKARESKNRKLFSSTFSYILSLLQSMQLSGRPTLFTVFKSPFFLMLLHLFPVPGFMCLIQVEIFIPPFT